MFNRRKFLLLSLFAFINQVFSFSSFASTDSRKKITKFIPSTAEAVPVIGMGTWLTFDVGHHSDEVLSRTQILKTFLEAGGSVIDSSPMYGSAEKIIGLCLQNIQGNPQIFSASKVWTPLQDHGKQQIENSFRLWGLDQFSLLQVHNLVNYKEHLQTLIKLKSEKRIKYIGVTTSHGNKHSLLIDIMNNEPIDFVQFTYNITHDEAEHILLPLANRKKIAVIINRPFDGGNLFRQAKNKTVPDWAKQENINTWSEFFLKFIISHPAVTCVIPATSKIKHMQENMQSLYGTLPSQSLRIRMKEYFKTLL